MKIIEAGDFTYVSYNEENSAKHNGVHLYVPGHLDGEKYEDDGRLTGTCPVPMDDYGFAELSYTQDGISTCKRLRLAIVEGTVDELRGLALGDCHLRSNAKLQQSYINDSLKNQAARIGGDTLSTVAQVEIDRRLRIANALLKDIDRINCGGHPDPIMDRSFTKPASSESSYEEKATRATRSHHSAPGRAPLPILRPAGRPFHALFHP